MRSFGTVRIAAATALLTVSCSSGDSGDAGDAGSKGAEPKACSYDSPKELLSALRDGFGDEATVHMDMEMTGGGADMTMTGDIRMTEADAAMDLRTTGETEFAMIVVDDRYFIAESADDPEYTEIPAGSPTASAMRQQLRSANLRTTFDAFDAGLKGVKSVGHEEIDGASTCHYQLEVDSTKALEAQGQKNVPAGMPRTIDYDLFLDEEDQMRRMTFELGPVEMVMDMTKWGEPVDIKAPKTK